MILLHLVNDKKICIKDSLLEITQIIHAEIYHNRYLVKKYKDETKLSMFFVLLNKIVFKRTLNRSGDLN